MPSKCVIKSLLALLLQSQKRTESRQFSLIGNTAISYAMEWWKSIFICLLMSGGLTELRPGSCQRGWQIPKTRIQFHLHTKETQSNNKFLFYIYKVIKRNNSFKTATKINTN